MASTVVLCACAYVYTDSSRLSSPVTGILVLGKTVRRTQIFSENFGPPDHFYRKKWSGCENFGPPQMGNALDAPKRIAVCAGFLTTTIT